MHEKGQPTAIVSQPAVPVFDGRYQPGWVEGDVPKTGTTIRVNSVSSTGFMQVTVALK